MGKTTLIERAVAALKQQGRSVLAVKSSHHRLQDKVGSDSDRLRAAGADGVGLLALDGCQLFLESSLTLEDLLPLLCSRYEVALIEGGKSTRFPKVELLADSEPLLAAGSAVASLQRGEPECPDVLACFVELIDSKGLLLESPKA